MEMAVALRPKIAPVCIHSFRVQTVFLPKPGTAEGQLLAKKREVRPHPEKGTVHVERMKEPEQVEENSAQEEEDSSQMKENPQAVMRERDTTDPAGQGKHDTRQTPKPPMPSSRVGERSTLSLRVRVLCVFF